MLSQTILTCMVASLEPDPPTSAALDVIKITSTRKVILITSSAAEVGGSGSRLHGSQAVYSMVQELASCTEPLFMVCIV